MTTVSGEAFPRERLGASSGTPRFELRFVALADAGRGLAFPCDATGCVDLAGLRERARANYVYACRAVGRDFHSPIVRAVINQD